MGTVKQSGAVRPVQNRYETQQMLTKAVQSVHENALFARQRLEGDQKSAMASLQGLIETEIVPRLMMNHVTDAGAAVRRDPHRSVEVHLDLPDRPVQAKERLSDHHIQELAALAVGTDFTAASNFVEGLRKSGISEETLLLDLIPPAARTLGEKWESDELDFVDVTLGLNHLQVLVAHVQLSRHPRPLTKVLGPDKPPPHIILVPAPNEQHLLGLQVLERFFDGAGWRTTLFPNFDLDDICRTIASDAPNVLGLSLHGEEHLETLTRSIAQIRKSVAGAQIKILVGGKIFVENPDLARAVGADGTASDGRQALRTALKLVGPMLDLRLN